MRLFAHLALWKLKCPLVSCLIVLNSKKEVLSRLHFSPVPVFALGNWIPNVLYYWGCMGHNCGLSQAVFTSEGKNSDT